MSECYKVIGKEVVRCRRHDNRRYLLVLLLFVMAFTFVFLKNHQNEDMVEAADLTKFDPGYIISDYQMSNYTSMTEAEIQKFLTLKNPCNNRDESIYQEVSVKYPNITWHFEDGHFICLSEEKFGDGEVIGKGETAAHIIWQAAQDYKINPQVIIVLLQKEQGLITDVFPNSRQYRAATGYGCPDTAACSTKYYGFKNQVRNAALMFRTVLNGGWTNYPLGNNYIQYNPNAACGGSVVNVKNLATSSLYRYTPYQPNAAALAAGYGTASCGAYGNRNFYLYFEDWFGGITETYNYVPPMSDEEKNVVEEAMNARYEIVKKTIGEPIAKINCDIGHKDSCVRAYKNGVIIYSPETGAWENYGQIRERFLKLGSVDGVLGFPTGPMNCAIGHKGACVQAYQNGVIIYSPETGAWESYGQIREKFIELKSVDGVLGFPTGPMNCAIGHKGACVQAYQNGVIIYSPETGAWESYGEIRRRHLNNGSVDGFFGFPTSGVIEEENVSYQKFSNKTILKDSSDNYWVSTGEIAEKYVETQEILGEAIANANCEIGHNGSCVQAFKKGAIIYSPKNGAWESYGKVREEHLKAGTVDGKYGFPTSGVVVDEKNKTTYQTFENGKIVIK